jgi:hypothetical protein
MIWIGSNVAFATVTRRVLIVAASSVAAALDGTLTGGRTASLSTACNTAIVVTSPAMSNHRSGLLATVVWVVVAAQVAAVAIRITTAFAALVITVDTFALVATSSAVGSVHQEQGLAAIVGVAITVAVVAGAFR